MKKPKNALSSRGLKTYTKKERNMYLAGLAGQNIIYNVVGTGLQFYFESVIFLPALAVGTIMTLARVWDAFNDPMMGTFADRTRTKIGKFRPYLLIVPLPILIITTLCFVNFGFYTDPQANKTLIIAWAAVMYVLWGMTYTVGDIPLWGITAVMTEDDNDRNSLLSLARIFAGIGGGISLIAIQPAGTAIGDMLAKSKFADLGGDLPALQGQRYGFLIAAFIFTFIGCALFQLVGIFSRERIHPSEQKNSIRQNFKLMWSNKPFRQLLVSGVLASPKNLIMLVAFTLVNIYYANNDATQMLVWYVKLGAGLFVGQFLAMAIIPTLVKKHEKKQLYNYSNLISAIPFLMIFVFYMLAENHDVTTAPFVVAYALMFTLAGMSIGAGTVLQSLMIADCIDYEEHKSGLRPDGVFFSGQSFITKLATGIATIMCSLGYFFVGFEKEKRQEVMTFMQNGLGIARENPAFEPFMTVMFFLISIPPAIGCILTVIPTWKYALPNKEHAKILAALNEKRHANENADGAAEQ